MSNVGFYGASGGGTRLTPGVEGEVTASNGSGVGGAFGLTYLAGQKAPSFGVKAFGASVGVEGQATGSGMNGLGPQGYAKALAALRARLAGP